MNLKKHVSPHGTVMAVSMMKDEAPFLLEWFAHHLAVGFTDILVYTNDCTDGTDDMLIRLEELGLGYHRRNDIPEGLKPQPSALKYAQAEPVVGAADWVLVFDADEFLCIKHGDGTLDGMISDAVDRGANGIVITWRIFGSGHVTEWSRDPVTEQYLYAAPPLWNKGWGVKTLFKFDPEYWKLGIHRPKIKNKHLKDEFPDTVHWLNGSGAPMEDYFKFRGWRSIRRTLGYDWAQMNHYALKSVDSYALRKMRGNVNNKKDKYNSDYWALQDRNEVRDESILRHSARRAEIMQELLKDPVLNKLHFAALERVEKRLEEHKQTQAYKDMVVGLAEAGKIPINKVVAKPPKARDPAKIAALMSDVERKSQGRPKAERRNPVATGWDDDFLPEPVALQDNAHIEVVKNHAIMIPADAAVFGPEALDLVAAGKYARKQMRSIHWLVSDSDKVLNVGGEAGVVALQALSMHPNLRVMTHTRREDLARVTETLADKNDLMDPGRLKITSGALVFDGDSKDEAGGLQAMLRDYRPTILRLCDPEITPERLSKLDMGHLRRIILPEALAEDLTTYQDALKACGFNPVQDWTDKGIWVFDKAAAAGQGA
ncbi:glycosyltransferase family 2 protein [Shimia sediminis]|uniref:glycosyltransferase family 2 protein n=1 Tax=Shimia sediminis TaxID=2497945 RepID=UPI001F3BD511|nr:glycosyltransferase family 2 protein [Shimia sediminis]